MKWRQAERTGKRGQNMKWIGQIKFRREQLYAVIAAVVIAGVIFMERPLQMNTRQCAVISALLICVVWWSTGWIHKNIASSLLLAVFCLFSGVRTRTVFAFPLSNSFLLILFTYIFSRGIEKSGLAEMFLEPVLVKCADSPLKALLSVVAMFFLTMYAIPQPLARLIVVSGIFRQYLDKTDAKNEVKEILMFGVFAIYVFVNCCTEKADIILNTTIVAVAGLNFSDMDWIRYMAVPSLLYLGILLVTLCGLFRKQLHGCQLHLKADADTQKGEFRTCDKYMLYLLLATVLFWMTEELHGIPAWIVTLVSIVGMFAFGVLEKQDILAVDLSTLLFLTAAMSIGGVMREGGTADVIFYSLQQVFPTGEVWQYILVMMLIIISMHMILGSNTTTLSVVTPGLIFMYGGIIPAEIIMCITSVTLATQWLFPFHSVGMMIGVSKGYFKSRHMLKTGLALTLVVFLAVFGLYLPWWKLTGAFALF